MSSVPASVPLSSPAESKAIEASAVEPQASASPADGNSPETPSSAPAPIAVFTRYYCTWSGWRYFPADFPGLISTFLTRHYPTRSKMHIPNMKPYKRLQFHRLAESLGLYTNSHGDRRNRCLDLTFPPNWQPSKPEELEENPTPERKRKRRFEDATCSECGADRDEAQLGMARDGSILCGECYEESDMNCYKFESLSDIER